MPPEPAPAPTPGWKHPCSALIDSALHVTEPCCTDARPSRARACVCKSVYSWQGRPVERAAALQVHLDDLAAFQVQPTVSGAGLSRALQALQALPVHLDDLAAFQVQVPRRLRRRQRLAVEHKARGRVGGGQPALPGRPLPAGRGAAGPCTAAVGCRQRGQHPWGTAAQRPHAGSSAAQRFASPAPACARPAAVAAHTPPHPALRSPPPTLT